jgi:hypothetical protein
MSSCVCRLAALLEMVLGAGMGFINQPFKKMTFHQTRNEKASPKSYIIPTPLQIRTCQEFL